VKVKNAGDFDADEVVQLYISVPDPEGNQPRWSLKNFTRVTLGKGESTTVSFKLDRVALEQFNEEGVSDVVPGSYQVHIGNCSPGDRSEELGAKIVSAAFVVK
jgi:beta-glucosidase